MESDEDNPTGFIEDALRLDMEGDLDHYALAEFKPTLMAVLEADRSAVLDVSRAWGAGAAFVQFVCAAHRSFAARGRSLRIAGLGREGAASLEALGLDAQTARRFGFEAFPAPLEEARS
ncbi:MAG: STAS domain-containing protein [Acidobacteriota bacterium]